VRAEADALASLERLRENARRQLIRRMNELPQNAFVEIMVLLLERLGVSSLRSARRPGLPQGEVHLAGVARRANEELRVAVLIKRGGEIGRERVIELRGSLHHYGPAQSVWVLSTGSGLSGAREEAAQTGTAPVSLIDGGTLSRLLDEHSVGVRHATVNVPYLDFDLFDALRNG
jgi:restriction endonuclease Mrr